MYVNRPKYSVVIPIYNSHPYIRTTLNSVLAQTIDDFEIIVVDDGSPCPDGANIVRSYADPRVRLIVQDNMGLPGARNRGIAEAKGDYIALLDGDDQWYPFHLQGADDFFRRYPTIGWYVSHLIGVVWGDHIPKMSYHAMFALRQPYDGVTPGHSSAMVFKRELMIRAGGFPEEFTKGQEDRVAYAGLAKLMPVSGVYGGVSVVYNHHAGSITTSSKNQYSYAYWKKVYERLRVIGIHPARKYNSSLREVVTVMVFDGMFACSVTEVSSLLDEVAKEIGPIYARLYMIVMRVRGIMFPEIIEVSIDEKRGQQPLGIFYRAKFPMWSWKTRFVFLARNAHRMPGLGMNFWGFTGFVFGVRVLTRALCLFYRFDDCLVTNRLVKEFCHKCVSKGV